MRPIILLFATALTALSSAGCVVYARPAPVVAVADYDPVYYDGQVVYYDTVGLPYIYVGGSIRYVPRSYAHYDVLVRHYRVAHPHAYHRAYRRYR